MKLLFTNATIVTEAEVFAGDVLVDGERIARVDAGIAADGARVIDASGKYLLPGGVDVHTHFDLDTGSARTCDDFHSGTVAAACGGTTTVVDHMGFGPAGCALGHQVAVYRELARDAVIDYGLHGVIQHVDDAVLADMEALLAEGITSHKVYMTYGYKLNDADILRVLARARELGVMVCAHCENDEVIGFLRRRLLAEGKVQPRYHAASRPPACEAEAVFRFLMLASAVGDAPVYVVHLSSAMGLDAIRLARSRGQKHVYAETCPQYLLLDEGRYADDAEGLKYIMSPPLRGPADNDALWRGLDDGSIDVVATDHCPFTFGEQKQAGRDDFSKCPNGAPGVEERMGLMFSEGFMKKRLSLQALVRYCCAGPARLFGLYPRKGAIRAGADADLVLFDPEARRRLTIGGLHGRVDYSNYEGFELSGAPVMTVSRGRIVCENGVFVGEAGWGRYLSRNLPLL